jgi:hypothetical protein
VVEFQSPPQQKLSSDRFLFCIYREEELSHQEGLWQGCT